MDFEKLRTFYIFRPPTSYRNQDQVLQKCAKLKKEFANVHSAETFTGCIPQIREYFEEIQRQLETKGKWWGRHWTRYNLKYEELENAFLKREIAVQFYKSLLILKFSPQVSSTLKEALFFKAMESELEVVPE
jgi:hypothetical protein